MQAVALVRNALIFAGVAVGGILAVSGAMGSE
jgi:hypothetical protein